MPELISETRLMWGMPITVTIVASAFPSPLIPFPLEEVLPSAQTSTIRVSLISQVFDYFQYIDDKFSPYKPDSEISLINRGVLDIDHASPDMQTVYELAEMLRLETDGYFNIRHDDYIDPSGLVKGWAISNAANLLASAGCENFYIEAGGDFQAVGCNAAGKPWRVGIRNPFRLEDIVKFLSISDRGVATSGTYIRGHHIYDPLTGSVPEPEILSITVIGPDVYEADCYATAAFAMGRNGIRFIESLEGFEGYMIDSDRQATFTSGFNRYVSYENH